jgi:hypothetical protein
MEAQGEGREGQGEEGSVWGRGEVCDAAAPGWHWPCLLSTRLLPP